MVASSRESRSGRGLIGTDAREDSVVAPFHHLVSFIGGRSLLQISQNILVDRLTVRGSVVATDKGSASCQRFYLQSSV